MLISHTQCDHVTISSCASNPSCLNNIDKETVNVIMGHMYNTTDPCEDFWDYACGSWTAQPYYDHEDTLGALTNNYAKEILQILTNLQNSGSSYENSVMVQKIWRYYQSCRSSGGYYLDSSKYLKELPIDFVFGKNFQWDLLFSKNSTFWDDYNWLQTLSALRKYGLISVFVDESVGFASNDSLWSVMELKIPQPENTFSNKFEILEIIEDYKLASEQSTANVQKLVDDIYKFDEELRKLYKIYEIFGVNSSIINLEELININLLVDWKFYFARLINDEAFKDLQIPLEIYGHMDYFYDLQMIISSNEKYIVAWYFVLHFAKYLNSIKPLITDRDCILHTSVMFPLGVNFIYNRFVYKSRHEDEMILQNILEKLKQQFFVYLYRNKFDLDDQEMQYLKDKLSAVHLQIGNLPQQLPSLNDYYSSAQLVDNNFYANHLEMLKFRFQLQHQPLWTENIFPLDIKSFYVNDDISSIRNAPYFIHALNLLVVPELFLQLPFYHHQQHSLFHYSLVGWIMAHELSHSFDLYGLRFDSQGNRNSLGHQISLKTPFSAVMKCLSCHSPTTNALNERVADVNGLQLVWDVYLQNSSDPAIPASDFSNQQLFLLNFAQFFCGSLPQAVDHDRDDVRVRVSVENLREFSQVFQCSKEVTNSSSGKCDIWRK